ncbi:DUF6766 family protein [Microbacterium horticulturae]
MMKRFLRDNGLSLCMLAIFLAALIGQSFAGWAANNEELVEHSQPIIGYGDFVSSSAFLVDVAENWQSEFLQFFVFIFATIWLIQRGSPESKKPGDQGLGTDEEQMVGEHAKPASPLWAKVRGFRGWLYGNSLLITMGAIFFLSWFAQSLGGMVEMNEENAEHGVAPLDWIGYVSSPDFWNRTLQNWQSEFLAVGAMVAFTIYLRQRGSSESKPVGTPHATSSEEAE